MTLFKKWLFVMTMVACAAVQAEDTGIYLGGSLGYASIDTDEGELQSDLTAAGLTGTLSVDDDDLGWKLYGGYRFNQYFAAELAYVDLGTAEADVNITAPVAGSANVEAEADGVTLALIGRYPFNDKFSAFAKAGAFFWEVEGQASVTVLGATTTLGDDDDGTDFVFGLGADYALTDHISLRAEWERYDMDEDVDMFSAGIEYRF